MSDWPGGNFFDINKLPAQEGILVFPISMSRIATAQSAENCWKQILHFSPKKIVKPLVGVHFIYGDYLYFNSDEKASDLKKRMVTQMITHKNEFEKIVQKNPMYIKKAFSFITWGQNYLDCPRYTTYLGKLRKMYHHDKKFQKCVAQDAKTYQRELNENQVSFFLDEILMTQLIMKGIISIPNDYIQNHQKWVLFCYPGKPLQSQAYFQQKNPFELENPTNKYENSFYDLETHTLYDLTKLKLE